MEEMSHARTREKASTPWHRASEQAPRAMLVGREHVERSAEKIRESAGPAWRDAALRVPAFPAEKRTFGEPRRLRRGSRHESSHAHIGQSPATDIGRRPAGRPASTAVVRSLARSDDDKDDDASSMPRRQLRFTCRSVYALANRLRPISGSSHDTLFRESP